MTPGSRKEQVSPPDTQEADGSEGRPPHRGHPLDRTGGLLVVKPAHLSSMPLHSTGPGTTSLPCPLVTRQSDASPGPPGLPISWASSTHLLPLRPPWPRVLPDWLQPEGTRVGAAGTTWRLGGRSCWEHQGLGGGHRGSAVCCSPSRLAQRLQLHGASPSVLEANIFQKRKPRFREDCCLPKATGREEGASLLCLWVGPQPTAPGAPRVGGVLAGPAESWGAWASLGLGSLGASGSFCMFIWLRSPLAQALPEC